MKNKAHLGKLMLLVTAILWGASYVAMDAGNGYLGPFAFQSLRTGLAALTLLPAIGLLDRHGYSKRPVNRVQRRNLWRSGILCGVLFGTACGLQQVGLLYTTTGKAGFIQAFYIVLVPLIGLLLGMKNSPKVWIAVFLSLLGIYCLSVTENFGIGKGELLTVASAICFAIHILTVDRVVKVVDGVRLSCIQFFVCCLCSAIVTVFTEEVSLSAIWDCRWPLLYSGIFSCGVGFTLQILGQAYTDPTIASMIMSLESVFAVFFGWMLLRETMNIRELLGCGIMAAAIVLAQLPDRKKE